jgi:hypothetical protein
MTRHAEPAGDWIRDSWVVDDGSTFRPYFLRAPRALVDPDRRHHHAQIGHATSTDLREWNDRGVVLGPTPGSWDDVAVWSGSVVHGVWRMYYTAINTRGHELKDQRVVIASGLGQVRLGFAAVVVFPLAAVAIVPVHAESTVTLGGLCVESLGTSASKTPLTS